MQSPPFRPAPLIGLLLAVAAGPAAAQHTELTGRAGLSLFRFGGSDAAKVTAVNYYEDYSGRANGFSSDRYGGKPGAGFSLGGRGQRVGRRRGILAFEAGYDWLQSRARIDQVYYSVTPYSSFVARYPAQGSTAFRAQALTTFLGFGRRFALATVDLDVLAGPEVAYVFGQGERGRGTYGGDRAWATRQTYGGRERGDARLRLDLTAWYRNVGLTASYAHGLLNYQGNLKGLEAQVYARTLRLGLAYRWR